jgi:YbbR domain-containing protein
MGNIPRKNITAKLVALIMAAILWMYVMNEQNPPIEANFTIPLEIQNLAANYTVAEVPDSVRVKIRGPRNILAVLSAKDIKSYLDLKGVSEGKQAIKVHTVIPTSLELAEVNPEQVLIRIDTTIVRKMPVDINYTGAAYAGTLVGRATATPLQVAVEGPRSMLDAADRVVAMVDLTDRKADFSAEITLMVMGRDGKQLEGLICNPGKVNVAVAMAFDTDKKIVDVKPKVTGDLVTGIGLKRIVIEPDKLEIHGSKTDLEKVDALYTEPIDLSGVNKDITKEVRLQLPEGITTVQRTVIVHVYAILGTVIPGSGR